MTEYEKLLVECDLLGAKVFELDLGTDKPSGKCYGREIYINKNVTEKEKYCLLLEEIGHYLTTYGNITDQTSILNRKQELFARRWGYEHSVSLVGIINAFEYGAKNLFEIADFLGVTETYLLDCLENYKKKYGIGRNLEKYYVRFEPVLGVYKNFG